MSNGNDNTQQNVFSYTNAKGVTYYLHEKDVKLKNGRMQKIYFFARDIRDGALSEVPEGKEVFETKRTGMPVLRTKKDDDEESGMPVIRTKKDDDEESGLNF